MCHEQPRYSPTMTLAWMPRRSAKRVVGVPCTTWCGAGQHTAPSVCLSVSFHPLAPRRPCPSRRRNLLGPSAARLRSREIRFTRERRSAQRALPAATSSLALPAPRHNAERPAAPHLASPPRHPFHPRVRGVHFGRSVTYRAVLGIPTGPGLGQAWPRRGGGEGHFLWRGESRTTGGV